MFSRAVLRWKLQANRTQCLAYLRGFVHRGEPDADADADADTDSEADADADADADANKDAVADRHASTRRWRHRCRC